MSNGMEIEVLMTLTMNVLLPDLLIHDLTKDEENKYCCNSLDLFPLFK